MTRNSDVQKSRNGPAHIQKAKIRQQNSVGNKAGATKSPGANRSFGGNYSLLHPPNGLSNTGGGRVGIKPQSIGMHKRQTEFDNPLTSQTVDIQHMAILQNQSSHTDNMNAYKASYQNNGRAQKNLASGYLRSIDNQLR